MSRMLNPGGPCNCGWPMRAWRDGCAVRYTEAKEGRGAKDAAVLNLLGRLHHDNRSYQLAGDLYTEVSADMPEHVGSMAAPFAPRLSSTSR